MNNGVNMRVLKYFLFITLFFVSNYAQDTGQTFISLRNTGVEVFQNKYPEYDGRGTIILVLDTGVDMGVEGLKRTSTGEVKVIDVQDFTGQGDISFFEADLDEDGDELFFINEDKNYKVAGADKINYKSIEGEYFIGLLQESLWKNSGSKAHDLNGNGKVEDLFHFVTFEVVENDERFWVVYLDTDADGTLEDEKPIRTYKEKYDAFIIPNKEGLPKFAIGLNIFPSKNTVSFYFDDGAHGTHCAGISAGNKIGDSDFYGVAPGAYVIGLKLGNNNFAGGATVAESMKKAYLYADKVSRERKEPCIINMSYGIGAEIEGQSEIEVFLKELVNKNPYLYIATSNSNEGPGLTTTGLPSTSEDVFSTGAVLSKEVGNDLYGTTLDRDIILHFSSRGGEVPKPDVVAPGACVSTVPNFSKGDRMWGTSMASPYSAGVMAVLLGAAKIEYPDVKIPSKLLYKVLRESADKMEGYLHIDQGSGLINIEKAYSLLKKYIASNEINKFETYTIKSFAPNMPGSSAQSLYIRDASYLNGSEKFTFKVQRNNFNDDKSFYRIYNLKSDSEWLKVIQKKVHIRNNQSVSINAKVDKTILDKPGLYNAKIFAEREGKSNIPEFDLMATVIVPYEFRSQNNYELLFEDVKLMPGMHKRYFLKIPSGASNLNIILHSDNKNFSSVRYYLHDPDGREKLYSTFDAKAEYGKKITCFNELTPGIYEFVILGQYTSEKESTVDLTFEIDGINILGHSISSKGEVVVANYLSKATKYELSGEILGYQRLFIAKTNGNTTYELPFKLNKNESKKTFEISLEKETFNKVTDFAMMIYDTSGEAKSVGGLSYKDGSISIKKLNPDKIEKYKLVIVPGFANEPSPIEFKVKENIFLEDQPKIDVKAGNNNYLKLYPFVEYTLKCSYEIPTLELPSGYNFFGDISFKSAKEDEIKINKELKIIN